MEYLEATFSQKEHKRIFKQITINPNGCWEWGGALDQQGYGLVWFKKKTERIHRVIFAAMVQPIPKGKTARRFHQIDHTCKNKKCCNPNHLELVTQRENILRGASPPAINHRKDKCIHGHLLRSTGKRRWCPTCDYSRKR